MAKMPGPAFIYQPDPAHPGWYIWRPVERGLYNELFNAVHVRPDGPGKAIVRVTGEPHHRNISGAMHGGALLGLVDICLYAGARGMGMEHVIGGVTLDLSAQFIAAAQIAMPLDAHVELLRETRRFAFMRGLLVQEGTTLLSFSGTVRIPSSTS